MSKKGDFYDNAAMKSWNHSFKVEAKQQVFEYIEVYYNWS